MNIKTMNIKTNRIVPLIGAAAAMVAIAAAPVASAQTNGSEVTPNTGNAQIVATPGVAAQEAAQMQEPFGGDLGALLFRHG